MPIYEFLCKDCGQRAELLCKLDEKGDKLVCKNCGKTGLEKIFSKFATPGIGGNSSCGPCSSGSCGSCCH